MQSDQAIKITMKSPSFSVLFLVCFLFFLAKTSEAIIQCNTVGVKAAPCLMFAMGQANSNLPPSACCAGMQAVARSVRSLDDKKAVCRCLKAGAATIKGLQDKYLSRIPGACKIKVGFPVSMKTNCETIH